MENKHLDMLEAFQKQVLQTDEQMDIFSHNQKKGKHLMNNTPSEL